MLYDIRWFDSTKTGKVIVRKYQGVAIQNEGSISFTYKGKVVTLDKAECFANVWANGMWNSL